MDSVLSNVNFSPNQAPESSQNPLITSIHVNVSLHENFEVPSLPKRFRALALIPITLGPLVKWIYLIETAGLGRNLYLMAWLKGKALKYVETL